MAFLYRAHIHAHNLQLDLVRRNIPFNITIGVRFFEQAHLKDVTAYLKLVLNPRDELSFKRIVQLLPGIGGKGADKLWKVFTEHGTRNTGPGEVQSPESRGQRPIARGLQSCAGSVPEKCAVAWAEVVAI